MSATLIIIAFFVCVVKFFGVKKIFYLVNNLYFHSVY